MADTSTDKKIVIPRPRRRGEVGYDSSGVRDRLGPRSGSFSNDSFTKSWSGGGGRIANPGLSDDAFGPEFGEEFD